MNRAGAVAAAASEFLRYDLPTVRQAAAWSGLVGGLAGGWCGWSRFEFDALCRAHRSGYSRRASRLIERVLRSALAQERAGRPTRLGRYLDRSLDATARAVGDPRRLLGTRILVVKSPRARERGVIVADYSYVFPALIRRFDLEAIAARYFLVLEPSWSGYCSPELLPYARYDLPVFVQTIEPYDTDFVRSLECNLIPVPVAANWWVDHRLMKPDAAVTRDIDIIMVAAWARFKRHWRFFKILSRLRRRGHRPRVALVGYPMDLQASDIAAAARSFGVEDQIEFHERLPVDAVAALLRRAKVHVLWSRREGVNRAMVEALFADVPIVVRAGFNYGHRYPHINERTGRFATEDDLDDTLLDMLDDRARFAPRDWAMAHMSCQLGTRVLENAIRATAASLGGDWTEGLAVKTVTLNCQKYWNEGDRSRFAADYAFLESTIQG